MTGEMYRMYSIDPITGEEPDGMVWPLHAAIAKAVGGVIKPSDQHQGPYVLVGEGTRPMCRLWIFFGDYPDAGAARVYREDTGEESDFFYAENVEAAVDAALALMEPKQRKGAS